MNTEKTHDPPKTPATSPLCQGCMQRGKTTHLRLINGAIICPRCDALGLWPVGGER